MIRPHLPALLAGVSLVALVELAVIVALVMEGR